MKFKKVFFIGILVGLLLFFCLYNHLNKNELILEGNFSSKMGVMDPISCFCFNGGYIQTIEGNIPVCFDDEISINEFNILKVSGNYKFLTRENDNINSCNIREMKIFYVDNFKYK